MITKTKTHTYTTFDWLPASLLQLYEYEIVSSVDASDCSPLEFFLKKNLKVPHSPLSPNNYPVDSLINGAATELDGLLKRKGTSIKPLPPHLSKDLVIFHPLNPTLQPPLAQRKVSPSSPLPESRTEQKVKPHPPGQNSKAIKNPPSLLSNLAAYFDGFTDSNVSSSHG